jgi:hypothetical protein
MNRARIDREAFFKLTKFEPHAGQRLVIDNFDPAYGGARYVAAACGTRWGKDWLAAHLICASAISPHEFDNWTGWCIGAFMVHAEIGFGYCVQILTGTPELAPFVRNIKAHDGIIELVTMNGRPARIVRRSAERGAVTLVGASVDFAWLIEASAIPDSIYHQSIATRLIDREGIVLALSTPRGPSGWFPDMVRRGIAGTSPDTWAIRAPTWQNDRLDRKELFRMKQRMRPAAFAQEIKAEFVSFQGAVFDAEVVRRQATAKPEAPVPGDVYYAALDLAMNRDFNVLTIAKMIGGRLRVVFVDRWTKLEAPASVSRILRTCNRYNVASLAVDAGGLGKPIVDMLRQKGDVPVVPFVLAQQSKAALVGNLGLLLDQDRLSILAPEHCPEAVQELTLYSFVSETGGASTQAPAGGHDDCVMSLALLASFARPGAGGAPRAHVKGHEVATGAEVEDDEAPAEVDPDAEHDDDEDDDPNIRGDARPTTSNRRATPPSRFGLGLRGGSFNLGMRRL